MKSVFLLSIMSISVTVWAAQDWRIVSETTDSCEKNLKVLAKEGEKFIYIDDGESKIKLPSVDGSAFSVNSGKSVVFSNTSEKSLSNDSERFTYIQPTMVDGNPPKLNSTFDGKNTNCKVKMR